MYTKYGLNLTEGQKKKMAKAAMSGEKVSLRLLPENFSGTDEMMLTESQIKRIEKHKRAGKGFVMNFSVVQLKKMSKSGGFLPALMALLPTLGTALATGAATAGGSYLFNKLINRDGKGLRLQGTGTGGMIIPPVAGKGAKKAKGGSLLPGMNLGIDRPVGAIATLPKEIRDIINVRKGGWVPGYTEPEHMMKPLRGQMKATGGCCGCDKKNVGEGLYLHGTPKTMMGRK